MQEGRYSGERNDGKLRHGKGRLDWPNGDFYEGEFKDGLRSGHGVYSCKGGKHTYEGGWRLGKRHGEGEENWPNGQKVQREPGCATAKQHNHIHSNSKCTANKIRFTVFMCVCAYLCLQTI